MRLKQWKYLNVPEKFIKQVLNDLTVFNRNKERAFLRRGKNFVYWNAEGKKEEALKSDTQQRFTNPKILLRRDLPDTGAAAWAEGSETGVAYGIEGISEQELCSKKLLEVFANPHASVLEQLVF